MSPSRITLTLLLSFASLQLFACEALPGENPEYDASLVPDSSQADSSIHLDAGLQDDRNAHNDASSASDASLGPDAAPSDSGNIDSQASNCVGASTCNVDEDCAAGELCENDGSGSSCCQSYACEVTLCLTGAIHQDEQNGNMVFEDLCAEYGNGIIEDCDDDPCFSSWDNYSILNQGENYEDAYAAFFDTLDSNADGLIDNNDAQCIINVLGYSWGGLNAVYLSTDYINDARVALERSRVHRLIVIDPFQRTMSPPPDTTPVPSGVRRFWEYRHSISPSGDCSENSPFGPYEGVTPTCPADVECHDFDFSQDAQASYPAGWGNWGASSYQGSEIGHCGIVDVAYDAVLANLRNTVYSPLPNDQAVPEP